MWRMRKGEMYAQNWRLRSETPWSIHSGHGNGTENILKSIEILYMNYFKNIYILNGQLLTEI